MISTRVQGGFVLPVGKIVAVGRNYADHAQEMGAERPTEPLLFLKPSTALVVDPDGIALPKWSNEVHHEVELVVRIGVEGAVDAFAVGVDLTARDVQKRAKERGEPWAVAKGFDGAAPISTLQLVDDATDLSALTIELAVSGSVRQSGRTADMLWSVPELLAAIRARFTLEPGDLVFTGTPAGVGALAQGDTVDASLVPGPALSFRVA